ncbi:MAG: histidine kinase [Sulfuriferula sp.]|nr:histidine kinase [Sulfuriferula sp.]
MPNPPALPHDDEHPIPFQQMVEQIPGLIFQLSRDANGVLKFIYLNERCMDVLGMNASALRQNASLLADLIVVNDKQDYFDTLMQSAHTLQTWYWKGRIQIPSWQDIKWVSIRATPMQHADNNVLWNGIITNVTQTKQEELAAKQMQARLLELTVHDEKVKEQERTRIAREIHDELGGNLTAIKMAISLLKRKLEVTNACVEKVDYIDKLADNTITAVRRIASDLRPSVLDLGLVAAIQWQVDAFVRHTGTACELICADDEISCPADQASALFRVTQEALTNISKHAQASLVHVYLEKNEMNTILLSITDNGIGIQSADQLKSDGFGLRGMRERIGMLGGQFNIDSSPQMGTVLNIALPL